MAKKDFLREVEKENKASNGRIKKNGNKVEEEYKEFKQAVD